MFYTNILQTLNIYTFYKWAFGKWPKHWLDSGRLRDMTYLELFPVVVAILVWGQSLANLRILFYIDNQAVLHVVNEQTSKLSEVMILVREMV